MIARRPSSRSASASTDASEMFATASAGRRQRLRERVGVPHLDRDAVGRGVRGGGRDGERVDVDGEHGAEAEPGGGDREHARAAADVERGSPRGCVEQQLEAEARRRMRAGAERAAGVDHDREWRRAARSSHGGPTQSGPIADGVVELAPAILPARLDVGHESQSGKRRAPARRPRRTPRARRTPPARPPRSLPARARRSARGAPRPARAARVTAARISGTRS